MFHHQTCKYIISSFLLITISSAFELNAIYTQFSGLVTDEITVGSNRQPLRLSLDFRSKTHVIFDSRVCPLFVTCFDSSTSVTFHFAKKLKPSRPSPVIEQASEAVDEIDVGDDGLVEPYSIHYVTKWEGDSVYLKEVAGVIGAGVDSKLFGSTIVELSDAFPHFNGIRLKAVSWREAHARTDFLVSAKTIGSKWMSSVLLSIREYDSGGMIPSQLHFDPSIEDLILPVAMKKAFETKLSKAHVSFVISDDILFIACTIDPMLDLSLRFASGEVHLLNQLLLQFPIVDHPKSSGVCASRIKFSATKSEAIAIGRLLIRSVNALFLDYDSSLIGFDPLPLSAPRKFPNGPPESLIPIFDIPNINVDESTRNVVVQFPRSSRGSLILASLQTINGCWTFYRTSHSGDIYRDIELPGDFKDAQYRIRNNSFSITLSPNGPHNSRFKGSVRMRNRTVQVCIV
jgi:hypothetical protein